MNDGYNGIQDYPCTYAKHSTWFNVKLVVSADTQKASIYLDGELLTDNHDPKLPHRPSAGVVVANGYDNIVYFKKLHVLGL